MSPFLFGFRQVSSEILHSETDWAAIVLPTSHVRGLLEQMFGHAHMRVCFCVFWFTLDFISIPVSFKYKITIFLD